MYVLAWALYICIVGHRRRPYNADTYVHTLRQLLLNHSKKEKEKELSCIRMYCTTYFIKYYLLKKIKKNKKSPNQNHPSQLYPNYIPYIYIYRLRL